MFKRVIHITEYALALIMLAVFLGYSSPPVTDPIENIRVYTRQIEFDYVEWTIDAALVKIEAAAAGFPFNLDHAVQKKIVTEYLRLTQKSIEQERALEALYADSTIKNKEVASAPLRAELSSTRERLNEIAPIAESVLQHQVSEVLADIGLTIAGQPIPNVLYHSTPLPMALIVSPRERIEQTANISIETGLTVDQQAALEAQVDANLNVSSLVVPIGGVGVYPTMVMRNANIRWTLDVVAHEWIHNYLSLRPLGILYNETPELRTMNETTASIAGNEIGALVLERFYPELTSASFPALNLIALPKDRPDPEDLPRPPFDFRAEMYETRVTTDALLAEGNIAEAEAYMEKRRLLFLKNGHLIRKLNQAYFAFYGAYADVPGGAAGEDPVGPAVRALRAQSESLADFVNRISWMTSFQDLQEAVSP